MCTTLLARGYVHYWKRRIITFNFPLDFPKNLPSIFFLKHLHGVDASGVIYCLLLLTLT